MHISRHAFSVRTVYNSHVISVPKDISIMHFILAHTSVATYNGIYRSTLEWAVMSNRLYIAEFLIACGANVNSSFGICLIVALWHNNRFIVNILIQAGADVNLHDIYAYKTPLIYAIECASAGIVTQLLDAGALLPPDAMLYARTSKVDSSDKIIIINEYNKLNN